MGTGASVIKEDVEKLPQYTILGGDAKFEELKDSEGKVQLDKVEGILLCLFYSISQLISSGRSLFKVWRILRW
jgi:hypothetical protein